MYAASAASAVAHSTHGRANSGGMEASDIERMRDLEHENARLKQMYADPNLENRALKDVIEKSFEAGREA